MVFFREEQVRELSLEIIIFIMISIFFFFYIVISVVFFYDLKVIQISLHS